MMMNTGQNHYFISFAIPMPMVGMTIWTGTCIIIVPQCICTTHDDRGPFLWQYGSCDLCSPERVLQGLPVNCSTPTVRSALQPRTG